MKTFRIKDIILVALFAALTAVGAFINFPITTDVPFSLQVFFVLLVGAFLGARLGVWSQIIYILIGLVGVPIFTKGGGIGYIFQPSFGYLIGFILCAFIIGKLVEKATNLKYYKMFAIIFIGICSIYLIGVPYQYVIVRFFLKASHTIALASLIKLIPIFALDMVKGIVATIIVIKIQPVLLRLK